MKNYIQSGDMITATAPADLASGAGVLIGSLFGFAANPAKSGEAFELATTGVFDAPKAASQAWTVGAKVYWDDTAKNLTTVSTDNTLVGVAVLAVGSSAGETTGRVRLGKVA